MVFYTKFYVPLLKRSFFIAKNENGICFIDLNDNENKFIKRVKKYLNDDLKRTNTLISREIQQIKEYFKGLRTGFDLKIYLKGTGFQTGVWQELADTKYGETISYSELAKRARYKKAVRAVATCCSVNPVPIIIPCHRVIAKDGSLGGFGGGTEMKRKMLDLEKDNRK